MPRHRTPATTGDDVPLTALRGGGWRLQGWALRRVVAAITDRRTDRDTFLRQFTPSIGTAEAEQVHGGSVAVVRRSEVSAQFIAGCDALVTDAAGLILLIRTADCLPVFFAAPGRGAVGLAHAGWRGLSAELLRRVLAAFHHAFQILPQELSVAIGPAIRECCYEVGPEFEPRFGPFVRMREGRRTCDLVGVAVDQLRSSGVRPDWIMDAKRCTACESGRWFSLRREGRETGRLLSAIMVRS
jgi:YfiH family protein